MITCKNCIFFIPESELINIPAYSHLQKPEKLTDKTGYCKNIDKWVGDDWFCADGQDGKYWYL